MDPQCWKELERLHIAFMFLFLFSCEVQSSDLIGSRSHSYFVTKSIINSPELEANPCCSGLCLGGLRIWPNMRREIFDLMD